MWFWSLRTSSRLSLTLLVRWQSVLWMDRVGGKHLCCFWKHSNFPCIDFEFGRWLLISGGWLLFWKAFRGVRQHSDLSSLRFERRRLPFVRLLWQLPGHTRQSPHFFWTSFERDFWRRGSFWWIWGVSGKVPSDFDHALHLFWFLLESSPLARSILIIRRGRTQVRRISRQRSCYIFQLDHLCRSWFERRPRRT